MTKLKLNLLLDAITKDGYAVISDLIPKDIINNLASKIKTLTDDDFTLAGIGRGLTQQQNSTIRQDKIKWLDSSNDIDSKFLELMDLIRVKLNESLYLGLFDFEAHYAVYPKEAFYKKHIDTLKGKSNRVLSIVVYLNTSWPEDNGGELVLYDQRDNKKIEIIAPRQGTMVFFLSENFPHEVLAAKQTRYSIAGWFRVNASSSSIVDTIN